MTKDIKYKSSENVCSLIHHNATESRFGISNFTAHGLTRPVGCWDVWGYEDRG